MKIKDITNYIESIAPLNTQESYDNSGLIVGNPNKSVKKALVCLDSTEEVVKEAKRKKCDLIIAHHPIVFDGLKRFNATNYVQRAIMLAIKSDIAIYAVHTNLDNAWHGVSRKIADKIGLLNVRVLAPKDNQLRKLVVFCPDDKAEKVRNALFSVGAGNIGDYENCSFNVEGNGTFRGKAGTNPYVGKPGEQHTERETRIEVIFELQNQAAILNAINKAHPYEEVAFDVYPLLNHHPRIGAGMIGELGEEMNELAFLKSLKSKFKTKCIRHTALRKKPVKTVAVCGGSGSHLLGFAMAQKADAFVTADFKYHQFFDAEGRIVIADVGHFESELSTIELIGEMLKQKFPKFAVHFTEVNTNPINYL